MLYGEQAVTEIRARFLLAFLATVALVGPPALVVVAGRFAGQGPVPVHGQAFAAAGTGGPGSGSQVTAS